jgi:DNA-binding PadR family transcriptional regulator
MKIVLTAHDISRYRSVMRLERGGVRGLLLTALATGPAHGYELIRRLEESSGGAWSPSPGSVYPALALLEDQSLVSCESEGDKKIYTLTAAGVTAAQAAAATPKPWERPEPQPTGPPGLRELTHAVHAAARQVGTEGSPEQIERALDIMRSTRQQLYRLLAED